MKFLVLILSFIFSLMSFSQSKEDMNIKTSAFGILSTDVPRTLISNKNTTIENLITKPSKIISNNIDGKFHSSIVNEVIFYKDKSLDLVKYIPESIYAQAKMSLILEFIVVELKENIKIIKTEEYPLKKLTKQSNIDEEIIASHYIKDQLQQVITIHKNKQIQIGNSVLPFLNKQYLSDIDKTLFNSLNLLAINY